MYDPPSQPPYKTIWKPKKNLKIFVLGHEKLPKISKKFDTYSYVYDRIWSSDKNLKKNFNYLQHKPENHTPSHLIFIAFQKEEVWSPDFPPFLIHQNRDCCEIVLPLWNCWILNGARPNWIELITNSDVRQTTGALATVIGHRKLCRFYTFQNTKCIHLTKYKNHPLKYQMQVPNGGTMFPQSG